MSDEGMLIAGADGFELGALVTVEGKLYELVSHDETGSHFIPVAYEPQMFGRSRQRVTEPMAPYDWAPPLRGNRHERRRDAALARRR